MVGQKNMSVETLRGIAIVLVVAGHVVGSAPDGGMRIDYPSFWRYLYSWIDYIQMPLFTSIAGWVYALKPVGTTNPARFAGDKALRLLVPMATVSTVYFLTQYFVPGTNSDGSLGDMWRIYLFPYTMYWYLQSLFLIFLGVLALDRYKTMSSTRGWVVTLSCAVVLYAAEICVIPYDVPNLFSFKGALNQLPYFIAGVGICRFGKEILSRFRYPMALLAVVGIALLNYRWFSPQMNGDLYRSLLPLWVVPTLFIIFRYARPVSAFSFIGGYAYSIYLLHGFGTSGGRIILNGFGVHNHLVVFTVSFFIALLLPIAADRIISKSRVAGALLLGKPLKSKTSKI